MSDKSSTGTAESLLQRNRFLVPHANRHHGPAKRTEGVLSGICFDHVAKLAEGEYLLTKGTKNIRLVLINKRVAQLAPFEVKRLSQGRRPLLIVDRMALDQGVFSSLKFDE